MTELTPLVMTHGMHAASLGIRTFAVGRTIGGTVAAHELEGPRNMARAVSIATKRRKMPQTAEDAKKPAALLAVSGQNPRREKVRVLGATADVLPPFALVPI
jgi:hypothetical protein